MEVKSARSKSSEILQDKQPNFFYKYVVGKREEKHINEKGHLSPVQCRTDSVWITIRTNCSC